MGRVSDETLALAEAFIRQFPNMPGHPGAPHARLSSKDIDAFGIAQGVYGSASSTADFNEARNALVQRLNRAGVAKVWLADTQAGFQLVVGARLKGAPTEWVVKPVEVDAAHSALTMPGRNATTIKNRILKHDRKMGALITKNMTRSDRVVITASRDAIVDMALMQQKIAAAADNMTQQIENRLRKKDPQHRMLPK